MHAVNIQFDHAAVKECINVDCCLAVGSRLAFRWADYFFNNDDHSQSLSNFHRFNNLTNFSIVDNDDRIPREI